MQHSQIAVSTAYLAPLEYYAALVNSNSVEIEQHEYFIKQTYRNRCAICGANGALTLSIPLHERKNKTLTKDIRISNQTNWQNIHWRSIESAYNSSPFFEFYKDDLIPFYENKFDFLIDFNFSLQQKIDELVGLKINYSHSNYYQTTIDNTVDLRNSFSPKEISIVNFPTYFQVFEIKNGFIPDLSIIDLLFNEGPQTLSYLKTIF